MRKCENFFFFRKEKIQLIQPRYDIEDRCKRDYFESNNIDKCDSFSFFLLLLLLLFYRYYIHIYLDRIVIAIWKISLTGFVEENYYTGDGITISRNLINDRSVVERSWYYSKAPLPPETGDNFWCIATGLPWRPGYTTYEMQLFSVLSPSRSNPLDREKGKKEDFSPFLLKSKSNNTGRGKV